MIKHRKTKSRAWSPERTREARKRRARLNGLNYFHDKEIKMQVTNTVTFENLTSPDTVVIVTDPALVLKGDQKRRHRKKRINKKWLKRYGFKQIPDDNIYFVNGEAIMHPDMYKKIKEAIGEDAMLQTLQALSRKNREE